MRESGFIVKKCEVMASNSRQLSVISNKDTRLWLIQKIFGSFMQHIQVGKKGGSFASGFIIEKNVN